MARIAPSILSADYGDLSNEIARVAPGSDLLHVDVMDGHFVPNISIGPPVVKSIRKKTDMYFDCHLMIQKPAEYLEAFKKAGADGCSVHVEVGDTGALIQQMRELGLDTGLVVNPDTTFEAFEEFVPKVDMVVLMTVQPGFGGQSFMEHVMPKVRLTRELIERTGKPIHIEVDGGIDEHTAPVAAEAGADTFVAGSAIFDKDDPLEAAMRLGEIVGRLRPKS